MTENDFREFADAEGDDPEPELPPLQEVLHSLPLVEDDHYIAMQATNLAIVDSMIAPMEDELAAEYSFTERVPFDKLMPVSALTQLWIFGIYEFLRTWRQWVRDLLTRCEALEALGPTERAKELQRHEEQLKRETPEAPGGVAYARGFSRAARTEDYQNSVRTAFYRSDIPFGKLEALRVHLAKHEVPRGGYAAGAGYGRIHIDGSIQFHVPLGKQEMTMISRRGIAADVREMGIEYPLFILSAPLQAAVQKFPNSSYGIRRVRMVLDDGSEFEGAIAWTRHIVWVKGHPVPPFDAARVVDVQQLKEDD